MNHNEFRKQYMNEFTETERDRMLRELGEEYHRRCDAFDVRVCTGRTERGISVPIDATERFLMNQNVGRVLRDVKEKAAQCGFSNHELYQAIQRAAQK